ncbi:MAG: hypothetical protein F2545_02825 [Actinobacteria bacterium]|nr:hypothetical protein [Actinomycetota bacterium]MTA93274.1 hypothetical protein [Actinomycetota bacterium]
MGHVPQDPIHSDGESSQFQRRQRRGTSLRGHHHARSSVANVRLGRARWAEERAAQWYVQQGFVVLAKNWTMRGGELDVVVRRDSLVVICEVKARANNDFGSALEAMTEEKIRRVRRAGFQFMRTLEEPGLTVRFDVATVTGVQLEMFHDAF